MLGQGLFYLNSTRSNLKLSGMNDEVWVSFIGKEAVCIPTMQPC